MQIMFIKIVNLKILNLMKKILSVNQIVDEFAITKKRV